MGMVYLCTNLETGESRQVIAGDRKAAHEHASEAWAGHVVEVVSLEEQRLREVLRPAVREIRSWADAAYCELSEHTDVKALMGCLDAIEATVTYTKNQLQGVIDARA